MKLRKVNGVKCIIKKFYPYVLLIFCCLLCGSQQVMAARIQVSSTLGFQGYVLPGRWNPMFVEVKGGSHYKPEKLTLELIKQDVYKEDPNRAVETFPLRLSGALSRTQIPIYINESGNIIHIRIKSGRQILSEESIDSRTRVFPGHIILTSGLSSSMQQAISRSLLPREPVHTARVDPLDLPVHSLNYDGVSALVLTDQGAILNSAQIEAVRTWLAGGGKLILCNPRPAPEGMFSALIPEPKINITQIFKTRFGLGQVITLPLAVLRDDPVFWQELLDLKYFEDTRRLTAGQIFGSSRFGEVQTLQGKVKSGFELKIIILVWVLTGLAIAYFLNFRRSRLRFLALLIFTVFSLIVVFPVGRWASALWYRGVPVRTQALLLPHGGGVIFTSNILIQKGSPAWNLQVKLSESEQGEINVKAAWSSWEHLLTTYNGILQTGSEKELNITGVLSVHDKAHDRFWGALAIIIPRSGLIGQYDGRFWQQLEIMENGEAAWGIPQDRAADWIKSKELIITLHRFFPDYKWIFGHSHLPDYMLKIQNGLCNEVFWITPVGMEVEL